MENISCDKIATIIESELRALGTEEKRHVYPRFFKTGPGEYGEGDRFLGTTVPLTRSVAKKHINADSDVVELLLQSNLHECRLCALLIMVQRYIRMAKQGDEEGMRQIVEFYLGHTARINNWDLVDLSAPYILGNHLIAHDREILYRLADSSLLWEQRIAVVATMPLIKRSEFAEILLISKRLLHHPHDLMRKAIGWMLREIGKKDITTLLNFLDCYSAEMPRVMLRYSIEKLPEELRKKYLAKQTQPSQPTSHT